MFRSLSINGKRTESARRGSTYIFVVAIATLVSVVAIGTLGIQTSMRRKSILDQQYSSSGLHAQSAVEIALLNLRKFEDWRTRFHDYQVIGKAPDYTFANDTFNWHLEDSVDTDITNSPVDYVKIRGTGQAGTSTRRLAVTAVPTGRPLDILRTAAHCANDLQILGEVVTGLGPLSAGNEIGLSSGKLYGTAEAVSTDLANPDEARVQIANLQKPMPSRLVFQVYQSMAKAIDFSELQVAGTISNTRINRSSNPAGDPSSNGIYKISVPANQELTLSNCKLDATLVVLLEGEASSLVVDEGVVWNPASSRYPSLIVYTEQDIRNFVEIKCKGTFSEALPQGHPEGEAEVGGSVDLGTGGVGPTIVVSEPASLNGLFHVIRNVPSPGSATELACTNRITGCVVVEGDLRIADASELNADPNLLSHPPFGYSQDREIGSMLSNSDMANGLEMWTPVFRNEQAAATTLEWLDEAGIQQIRVANRKTAADGITQDITSWVESGRTYQLTADVTLTEHDESVEVRIEVVDENGLNVLTSTRAASTSGTNLNVSFQPQISGTLIRARVILCTTSSNQDFIVDDVEIPDQRTVRGGELALAPTTWSFEAVE